MKTILIMAAVLVLSGCASEVDKCVEANVKLNLINNPNHTDKDKARFEETARLACVKKAGHEELSY
jgi:protein involved in sex pheromone biosynthesis